MKIDLSKDLVYLLLVKIFIKLDSSIVTGFWPLQVPVAGESYYCGYVNTICNLVAFSYFLLPGQSLLLSEFIGGLSIFYFNISNRIIHLLSILTYLECFFIYLFISLFLR